MRASVLVLVVLVGCGGDEGSGRCGGAELGTCAPTVDDGGRVTGRPVCHLRRGVASCVEPSARLCGPGFPPCLVGSCSLEGLCE